MNHSRNKMKRFPLILNLNRNEIVAGYQQRLHVTYSGQIVSMVINSIRIRLIYESSIAQSVLIILWYDVRFVLSVVCRRTEVLLCCLCLFLAQPIMDNQEKLATLSTQDRTKTNKTKTQHKKLKQRATRTPPYTGVNVLSCPLRFPHTNHVRLLVGVLRYVLFVIGDCLHIVMY